ncbi:MAG: flagellar motor switch protein FliN [Holosporaceae bacterium]|jgi:flagellar motor switch protein FliN/FliY|nr:flagellar motor switch protein FliN [Rhodospirillaceae bacterium]
MSNENPFGSDNVEISTPDSNSDIKLRELEAETPTAFEPKLPNEEDRVPANVLTELGAVYEIPVQISAVLGRATMKVSQLLKLGRGAVVELDRKVGEAIDIYVNNRLVARGEVVIVEDRLGITMTEIIKSENSAGIN